MGLHFLSAMSSGMIHGVQRDAERIAWHIASRTTTKVSAGSALGDPVAAWLPQQLS